VEQLTSAEEHRELHFVAFLQKLAGVIDLGSQVVFVGFGPEPDFLQRSHVADALFVRVAYLAFLLIQPFAVIHYPADRRAAFGGDLHKVQTGFTGFAQRLR